jgi:hypothetical protein
MTRKRIPRTGRVIAKKVRARGKCEVSHFGGKDPSKLQRILVRHDLHYEDAAIAICKLLEPAPGAEPVPGARRKPRMRISSGYLGKIANGQPPSLKLGRIIVRWAESLREELTLADLGIEVA